MEDIQALWQMPGPRSHSMHCVCVVGCEPESLKRALLSHTRQRPKTVHIYSLERNSGGNSYGGELDGGAKEM